MGHVYKHHDKAITLRLFQKYFSEFGWDRRPWLIRSSREGPGFLTVDRWAKEKKVVMARRYIFDYTNEEQPWKLLNPTADLTVEKEKLERYPGTPDALLVLINAPASFEKLKILIQSAGLKIDQMVTPAVEAESDPFYLLIWDDSFMEIPDCDVDVSRPGMSGPS